MKTLAFSLILLLGAASYPRWVDADPVIPEVIDTLDFFVTKHPGVALTGSHNHSQVVSGNTSYYVKWSGEAFEVHTWDDNFIYLAEDHSWKPSVSYTFSPGIWMKRYMRVGERI